MISYGTWSNDICVYIYSNLISGRDSWEGLVLSRDGLCPGLYVLCGREGHLQVALLWELRFYVAGTECSTPALS